jgi:hypothetical protein
MKELLYTLPLLACPVGMGLMMWFMMRGKKEPQSPQTDASMSGSDAATDAQIASLRSELDQLRAGQCDRETPADRTPGPASTRPR